MNSTSHTASGVAPSSPTNHRSQLLDSQQVSTGQQAQQQTDFRQPCAQESHQENDPQQTSSSNQQTLQTVPEIISSEQYNSFRLLLIVDQEARPTLEKVFSFGALSKCPSDTLEDYLKNIKGISNAQYRKIFNRSCREKIASDPSCKSFDVSLWFPVIQWGCEDLAPPGDDTWISSPDTLENHLKRIKDYRNDLMHNDFSISTEQYLKKFEEIRNLLTRTLELARDKYNIENSQVTPIINNMNTNLNLLRDKPLTQQDLEPIRNITLFRELQKILLDKGSKELVELFSRMSHVNPASMIAGYNIRLHVDLIFTSLEIIQTGRKATNQPLVYTDLIQHVHQAQERDGSSMSYITLIEGVAGAGKTTLIKLLLSDWASGKSSMKGLDRYKFILHTEGRNRKISSLSDLISCQMPTARESFLQKDHMMDCLFDLPTLIIIDGLDEMNSVSKKLFMEIVNLRRIDNIMIICTTRPERVGHFYKMIPDDIKTIHIKVTGISNKSMESFVIKYHEALRDNGESQQDTEGLLDYFRTTGAHLKEHWTLPLNLTLLTLLWAVNPSRVNLVTTAAELYMQIHEMTVEIFIGRLAKYEEIKLLKFSTLRKNVDIFISALCIEALVGLRDDDILLNDEATRRLKNICESLGLPSDEALGAFLMQQVIWLPTGSITQSSFPHKGQQDFYASLSIYTDVVEKKPLVDIGSITKDILGCLSKNNVPSNTCHKIMKLASNELQKCCQQRSTDCVTITGILRNFCEKDSGLLTLSKFENVFVILIGLFSRQVSEVSERLVEELVDLLKKSGVNNRDDWIRVLNNAPCSNTVSRMIAQAPRIMEGTTEIKDADVFAYATLFKDKQAESVEINISANPFDVPRFQELLQSVIEHGSHVTDLTLSWFFRQPSQSVVNTPLGESLAKLMEKCTVLKYTGPVTYNMVLPKTIKHLHASIADSRSFVACQQFLQETSELEYLWLSVDIGIDPSGLGPIPLPSSLPSIYIPDVTTEMEGNKASKIAHQIQPTAERKSFVRIYFPRCSLIQKDKMALLEGLKGVKIFDAVVFPTASKPSSPQEKEELYNYARMTLRCRRGVIWGWGGIDEW